MRLNPDKERFIDEEATENRFLVYAVDLSDERSVRPFLTLWLKGKVPAVNAWVAEKGLPSHHDREVYHRDAPWLPATFPGKEKEGWSQHCHVDLKEHPKLSDFAEYLDEIPPRIQEQLRAHFA